LSCGIAAPRSSRRRTPGFREHPIATTYWHSRRSSPRACPTDVALTGTDEAIGWDVTGTVGGQSFTLVGITARVGGNVLALVGWDPATNTANVPLAAQMFVDELQ
jgi:hypothetical protein